MKSSIVAAAALLLNVAAVPAGAARNVVQSGDQPSAPAPGVDRDAQCAMFMRNIIVAMLVRGNLSEGERRYFDRYGVLFNYFAGRFSVGHEAAAAIPVLTATVRGLSTEVQARMDCYHDGDRTMLDVRAQIERAVPADRNPAPSAPLPSSGPADDDARCVAAVQRVVNERVRLIAREEMRNPDHVIRAVEYHAGRLVARGGSTAIEPAIGAAFAALPADTAAADTLGFRCVADTTRAIDAFSEAIAAAESAVEREPGPSGK
jgi:hypothetical protein